MASECSAEYAGEDFESVKQLQDTLQKATEIMDAQVLHEDVVIFIGTTKSGKSTLINYLLDNSLIGVKENKILSTCIKKIDGSANTGPKIGGVRKSETIIPTRWENPRRFPGLAIWDTPGFDDNRGKVQDITNAFYVYRLFERIKSVKIVLVADIQHVIREPINPFLSLLKSIEDLLREKLRECFASIVMVFTKVDESIEINDNLLGELLQPIWTNSSLNMSPVSRDFVRYLCEHRENVGFFKNAIEGPVTDAIEVGITEAIRGATSVPENVLKDVLLPSIVDSSKVFLYKCRDKVSSMNEFNELQGLVCESLQDIFENYSEICLDTGSRDQLHIVLDDLSFRKSQIDEVLDSCKDFSDKLKFLQKIHPKIEDAVRRNQLTEKSKLMEFIDHLLDLKECEHFYFNLENVLATAESKINELIVTKRLMLEEINKEEADRQIAEMKERYKQESQVLEQKLEEIMYYNQQRYTIGFPNILGYAGSSYSWLSKKIKTLKNICVDKSEN